MSYFRERGEALTVVNKYRSLAWEKQADVESRWDVVEKGPSHDFKGG